MPKRSLAAVLSRAFIRNAQSLQRAGARLTRQTLKQANSQRAGQAVFPSLLGKTRKPPASGGRSAKGRADGAGDWISGIAFGAAGVRRYYLFRPAGVGWSEQLPLVVMLHGCNQQAHDFAESTRMNRLASRERFLVLYPEQDRLANPQGCWQWYDTRSGKAQAEAATIEAAIDQVCRLYQVDPARVAIAGLSAGASMAALIAARRPARFQAVAMHSGIPPGAAQSSAGALRAMVGRRSSLPAIERDAGSAWPALLVIHGTADAIVSSRNAESATELWAAAAGASAVPPRQVRRGQRHPMHVIDYKHRGRTRVTRCEVSGLGHAWSGGGARQRFSDPKGPDASRMIWAFAARQFAHAAVKA